MNQKTLNRLFIAASVLLLVAGVIFLCISAFGGTKSTAPLALALGCITLSNLLNVLRLRFTKNNRDR